MIELTYNDQIIETVESNPIIGLSKLTSYSDITTGVDVDNSVDKFFKYSRDGVNWSEIWQELNDNNLAALQLKPNHIFLIKYKFIKHGSNTITIDSVELNGVYVNQYEPDSFKNHYFNELISYWNLDSLKWYVNVMGKIYKRGILPDYIDRKYNDNWEDEDFIDLWFPIIYLASLNYAYLKVFKNIYHNKKLLYDYLVNEGLNPTPNSDINDLQYLVESYYNQISKRGGLGIFDLKSEGFEIDGEFIRLINKQIYDEFMYVNLLPHESNWCIGKSSPLYRGFRLTEKALKRRYTTLLTSSFIIGGITPDINNAVIISKDISYSISFDFTPNTTDFVLNLGAYSYNSDVINQSLLNVENLLPTNDFINETIHVIVGQKYHVEAIIFKKDINYPINNKINIDKGNNLSFISNNISMIDPYLFTDGDIIVENFEIKILESDNSRYIVSNIDKAYIYMNNRNATQSEEELINYIESYLLPYNQINFFKTIL